MRGVGITALVLFAAEVLFLEALLPIDQTVWLLVLLARGCRTDQLVDQAVQGAVIAMIVLAVTAVALHVRRRGVAATWSYVALFAVGALANGVLKVVLSRERPSNLPGVVDGHGFPSGHVMNTMLAMIVVFGVAASFRRPWIWRLAAVVLTGIIAAGRILYGAHWAFDVVGAVLTAVALAGLSLPAFRRRPLAAPVLLAGALLAVVGVHVLVPGARLELPSPLTRAEAPFLDVEPGAPETSGNLSGNWSGGGYEDPAGSLAWVRGVGGVSVFDTSELEAQLRAEAGDGSAPVAPVPADDGPGEMLVMVARPEKDGLACGQVRLAVNGHIVASFVPFVGWREYRIPLPRGTYRRGFNELQIAVRARDGALQRLGVARFRLRLR